MAIKSKRALLTQLRSDDFGYTGKDDLNEVLAWLETEKDRITIDKDAVKALWAKPAPTLTIADDEPEVETVKAKSATAVADEDETDDDGEEEVKPSRIDKSKRKELTVKARETFKAPAARSTDTVFAKSYNHKASRMLTAFSDADEMAQFNASFRLRAYDLYAKEYPQVFANYKSQGWYAEDKAIIEKDASDTILTAGGALLANTLKTEVLWATEEWGISRFLTRNEIMVGNNTSFVRKTANPTWRALSSGAAQSTDISYDLVTLIPKVIAAIILTPLVLFEQSATALGDTISESLMESYWNTVDDCFFLGDGTATYFDQVGLAKGLTGVSGASNTGSYISGTGTSWATVVQSDFTKVMGSIKNANIGRACWVMSRQCYINTALRLATQATTGMVPDTLLSTANTYMIPRQQRGPGTGSPHATLLGEPVFFCQRLPVATATDTVMGYYGDFITGSIVGHRTQLEVASSTEYAFNKRALATRGWSEFAINICGDGRASSTECGPIAAWQTTH